MLQRKPKTRLSLTNETNPIALPLPHQTRLHHGLPNLRLLEPLPPIRMAQHKLDLVPNAVPKVGSIRMCVADVGFRAVEEVGDVVGEDVCDLLACGEGWDFGCDFGAG